MATVLLSPLTQWPDGVPRTLIDGRPLDPLRRDDTTLVIVPGASGLDEVRGPFKDVAIDAPTIAPTQASELTGDWYARAPVDDAPWVRGARAVGHVRFITRTLDQVPEGTDVLVLDSGYLDTGEEYGYAELPNVPLPYYNAAGVRLWTLPGESLSLPSTDYPLSAEQILRNELIRRGRRRVSRWVPARTGAQVAAGFVLAPDGTRLPTTARCARLSFGDVPPRAPTLRLLGVVGGLPWFASDDPRDARLGPIPGAALSTVASSTGTTYTFAVERDAGVASSPWYVMQIQV
jgi:hypothetical protein